MRKRKYFKMPTVLLVLIFLFSNVGFFPNAYAMDIGSTSIGSQVSSSSNQQEAGKTPLRNLTDQVYGAAYSLAPVNSLTGQVYGIGDPLIANMQNNGIAGKVYSENIIDKEIEYRAIPTIPLLPNKQGLQPNGVFMRHVIHMPNVAETPVPFTPTADKVINTPNPVVNQNNNNTGNSTIDYKTTPASSKDLAISTLLEDTGDESDLNLISTDLKINDEQGTFGVTGSIYGQTNSEGPSPGADLNQRIVAPAVYSATYKANESFPIRNKAGNFSVGFSSRAGGDLFKFSFKNAILTLGPVNPESVSGKVYKNSILYEDIYPDTDLKYSVEQFRLKEEIIVKKYTGQSDFVFQMGVENAVYKVMPDSTIMFYDPSSGQPLFYMPGSYAVDNNGNRCNSVSMDLTNDGQLRVSVDPNWLKNAAYPIIIDPTIYLIEATFCRPSVAYKQDGTQVASGSPRYEAAKFYQGITIEEGTTNLLTENESSVEMGLDGIFWRNIPQALLSRNTSTSWQGLASAKLQWIDATSSSNMSLLLAPEGVNVSPNTTYTVSAKVKANVLGRHWYIAAKFYSNGLYLNTINGPTSNSTLKWTTITNTFTTPANTTSATFEIVFMNALNGNALWYDGGQVEQKPYATSWTLGGTSRSNEDLTISTAGVFTKGNWAVEMFVKPILTQTTTEQILWCLSIDSNNRYAIWIDKYKNLHGSVVSNGTAYEIRDFSQITVGYNISLCLTGDGTTLSLYKNGTLIKSVPYIEPTGSLPATMVVGCDYGAKYGNSIIDDLRISNRARSATEVQAAFYSNQPLAVDSATTCKLAFDNNITVTTPVQPGTGVEPYWNYSSLGLGGGWQASVNTWNLNLIVNKPLFQIPGRGIPVGESITFNSIQGRTWIFGNNTSLVENWDGSVIFNKSDGGSYNFTPNGSGGYTAPPGVYLTLQKNETYNFTILDKHNNTFNYIKGKPYQFKDRNNNTTSFTYDSNGRLYQVSDPSGRKLTYAYDAEGHVISITDPANHSYRFAYQNDYLTSVTDPANNTFNLSYDANGRVASFTDPLNRVTSFYYNSNGTLWRLCDARTNVQDVYTTSFTQVPQGSSIITTITDPGNSASNYYHDNNIGNLTQFQDALGNTWQYTWTNNNLMSVQDAKGQTTYQYDSRGNVTSKTATVDGITSNNITETMTYDDYNQLLTVVDGSGRKTSFQYTNKGDLLSTSNPDLKESNGRKYDQYGNVVEYSPSVLGDHNWLVNGSMEMAGTNGNLLAAWIRVPGAATVSLEGFNSHGNSALKISSSTVTADRFYQKVYGLHAGDKLTLRADVKLDNVQGTNGGAEITLDYGSGYYESWYCWGSGTVPLILTSSAKYSPVTVYIGLNGASGTAWFDGVQLENAGNSSAGYVLGSFNSVENGGFEQYRDYWSYTGAVPSPTTEAAWEGVLSLKVNLPTAGTDTVYQDIPVYGGEPLTFSGMVKTNGITGTGAYYKIDYYDVSNNLISNAMVQTGYVTGTQDWTRLSTLATAPANANHARVQAILDGSGTVYFDAIKLIPRNSQKYTYDTAGNYVKISEDVLGYQNKTDYDANTGNLLSFSDALNNTTYYYYDNLNRLVRVYDPNYHNSYYEYDSVSNTIYTRDPRSASAADNTYRTYFGPNNLNQLSNLTDPLNQNAIYIYDRSGNLTEISLPNGLKQDFAYDNANRLIKTTLDGGKYFTYVYDGANELTSVTDQNNNSYSWNYDGAHRMISSTDTFGYGLTYHWDKSNNLITLSGSDYGNYQHSYGNNNELLWVSIGTSSWDSSYIYYDYDENGRIFNVRYPGSYNYRKINYDPNGWCSKIQDPFFPGQYNYNYYYNDNGTISGYSSWAGWDDFSYDADGRLTYWYYSPMGGGSSTWENYNYDATGNLLTKGSKTFTYNNANQITNAGFTYDANGNMTGDGNFIYVYNALNQLVQVKKASDGSLVATYTYNYKGLRRSKTVNGVTTNYNWDASGNMIRENTPSGNTYYYYDPSGNLVALKKNNILYIVHDNLRGDIESITDVNGSIVAQAHYDPWGNRVSASGSLVQPFRYAGYYYDDETGLYYLKNRYYSPQLGRFLTRDSIKYISKSAPQTLNLYSYCGNNPVSLTDPNGNWANAIEEIWARNGGMSKADYNNMVKWGSEYKSASKARQLELNKLANGVRAKYDKPSFGPTASSSASSSSHKPTSADVAITTVLGATTGLEIKSGNDYVDDGMGVADDVRLSRDLVQSVLLKENPGYGLMWKTSTIEIRNDGIYMSKYYYDALFGPNFGGT